MQRKSFCYGERAEFSAPSAHDRFVQMFRAASEAARATYAEYVEYLESQGQNLTARDRQLALELSIRTS